ncbi:MAG: sugar phosphorylase [Acidobacteria bacterium]|nr:sugar phosphorylase [Acidobacteriota bacterium]
MAVLRDASATQPARVARLQQARHGSLAPVYLRAHLPEPDYTRPLLQVAPEQRERIIGKLAVLYGRERAEVWWPDFERLMRVYHAHKTPEMLEDDAPFDPAERFSEQDVVLITYGDLLTSGDRPPLGALRDFVRVFMRGAINTVHILPFFPYSSDRGFSVIDFEEVDPHLGQWKDIEDLGRRVRLMFDGVFNHVSSKSKWFQGFVNGDPEFQDYFIAFGTRDAIDPDHLRLILRPRASDLLSPFHTINGPRFVWTTFSKDQVDLDYRNPHVLVAIVSILLLYVRRGADIIRLDAVTYVWRELGTRCAHLDETHALVQLFRAILDVVAPQVALITETNVPHEDNVSYFGDGTNEAQMVYNFALPPLVLHTFHTGSTDRLSGWARTLDHVSDSATYFNFLDSHDGIGLMGAQGILSPEEIDALVACCYRHGGLVSFRDNGDGTKSPYEMNATWYSALNRDESGEPLSLQVDRFIAARSIALVLRGVPGIYLPSLFGAKNDTAAVLAGAEPRSINRKTIDEEALFALLGDRESWVHQVAVRFRRLIQRRIENPAFHPNADQEVLQAGRAVFAVLRTPRGGRRKVLAVTNVTAQGRQARFTPEELGGRHRTWRDLISGQAFGRTWDGGLDLRLRPYGVLWLTPA